MACLGLLCSAAVSAEPEDELKAAAVLSFLRYSTWPLLPADGVTVAVVGKPAFAQVLARTLEGKSVANHPVHVVELSPGSDFRDCQVVYIATGKHSEIRQALAGAGASHVLTIGEADRFLDLGGAVHLFLSEGHINFETSIDTVERSGVSISSRLLRLGQVRDRGKAGRAP